MQDQSPEAVPLANKAAASLCAHPSAQYIYSNVPAGILKVPSQTPLASPSVNAYVPHDQPSEGPVAAT
ncbi:MAG: Uncharacterised protein [Cryomorphaceae bacterium]|nr:MAG: Uncharacterised protein [Cryomorphaceae bacterium]